MTIFSKIVWLSAATGGAAGSFAPSTASALQDAVQGYRQTLIASDASPADASPLDGEESETSEVSGSTSSSCFDGIPGSGALPLLRSSHSNSSTFLDLVPRRDLEASTVEAYKGLGTKRAASKLVSLFRKDLLHDKIVPK